MPEGSKPTADLGKVINFENLLLFLKVAVKNGVNKIRFSGGEPLLYRDLEKLIYELKSFAPDTKVALTTNASLLAPRAMALKEAGLSSINISLDSIDPIRAQKIAQKNVLDKVLSGIYSAKEAGLDMKLNTVLLRGFNDDQIFDLLHFARELNAPLRFIEYMPNIHASSKITGIRTQELMEIIALKFNFKALSFADPNATALYFEITDKNDVQKKQHFGVICAQSSDFCKRCNRIRLTSKGLIYPCLYFKDSVDIAKALVSKDEKAIKSGLELAVFNKPEKNLWDIDAPSSRAFYETGG